MGNLRRYDLPDAYTLEGAAKGLSSSLSGVVNVEARSARSSWSVTIKEEEKDASGNVQWSQN